VEKDLEQFRQNAQWQQERRKSGLNSFPEVLRAFTVLIWRTAWREEARCKWWQRGGAVSGASRQRAYAVRTRATTRSSAEGRRRCDNGRVALLDREG
jgi:hypothetical protein